MHAAHYTLCKGTLTRISQHSCPPTPILTRVGQYIIQIQYKIQYNTYYTQYGHFASNQVRIIRSVKYKYIVCCAHRPPSVSIAATARLPSCERPFHCSFSGELKTDHVLCFSVGAGPSFTPCRNASSMASSEGRATMYRDLP